VSGRASVAVNAAMSQQGVPYRFAASSPGVAFDCSGLTAYAWGVAGVSLPHQSAAQYASLPHVSKEEAQPGDLIFYYSPISHVGLYLGNGAMVHAPHTGKTVSVTTVTWGKVVGVARPG
jgi:cell wall-associated NlpC family hydrolase